MGYALIWVEGLAAAVLWVALGTVWGARRERRWLQLVVALAVALLPIALGGAAVAGALSLKFEKHGTIATDWVYYSLSWLLALMTTTFVVVRRGLRRSGDDNAPTARSWSASRLALLIATAITLQTITISNMDLGMKLQFASARSEAGAVLQTMAPPRVPEKDNAAPVYRQAFASLTPPEQLPPLWKSRSEEWLYPERPRYRRGESRPVSPSKPDPKDRDLREFVAGQEAGLALLRKAAAMPGCWFEREGTSVADTEAIGRESWYFDEVRQMAYGARVLAASARVKAANGDAKGALAEVAAILGIARHMPTYLLSYPSAYGAELLGLRTLAEILEEANPKAEDLAGLPLEDRPYRAWLRREEAVLAVLCVAVLTADPGSEQTRELWFKHWPGPAVDALEGTAFPLGRVFLAPDDLASARRAMREYQRPSARADEKPLNELAAEIRTRRTGLFTSLYLTPKLEKLTRDMGDLATLRRVIQVAAAAKAYKAAEGKYPERMSDLVPKYLPRALVDPWDGEPLQLHRQGEGVAIYACRWAPDEDARRYAPERTPLGITLR